MCFYFAIAINWLCSTFQIRKQIKHVFLYFDHILTAIEIEVVVTVTLTEKLRWLLQLQIEVTYISLKTKSVRKS